MATMTTAITFVARRWRHNTTTTARIGEVVRRRLFMGITASGDNLPWCNRNASRNCFSSSATDETSSSVSDYAVVDHSKAYERSMQGRHGQQLALAVLEGVGKDDLPFDPFEEEEQRLVEEEEEREEIADDADVIIEGKDGEKDDGHENDQEDDHDSEDDDDDYDSEDDEVEEDYSSIYNPDGSVRRKKSILATLKAGYPAGGLFAVLELAGTQHKVTTDDLLVVNKLKPVQDFKIGSIHTLKDVLLVGSSHLTLVGMPHVTGAEVDVMVEEITQDAKVIIFKKRRRKHSQRKNGYRRDLTILRVLDIRLPEEYKEHDHVGRESVDHLHTDSLDGSHYDDEVNDFDVEGEGQKLNPAQ